MVPYIMLMFICIAISGSIPVKFFINKEKGHFIDGLLISFILLSLFVGFRCDIGVDDSMYIDIFNTVKRGGRVLRDIESSYVFLSYLIGVVFNMNYHGIFLVYSAISFYCLYKYISFYVPEGWRRQLTMALLFSIFLLDAVTLMRQFAALSLILYSSISHKKKKVILFVLAVLMHHTALIMLPIWLLYKAIKSHRPTTRLIIICVAFIFQYIPLHHVVTNIIYALNLEGYLYVRSYLLVEMHNTYAGVVTLFYVLLYVMLIYLKRKGEDDDKSTAEEKAYDLAYLYVVLMFIFNQFGWLTRIPWYLIPYQILALSYVPNYFAEKSGQIVKGALITMSMVLFAYTLLTYKTTSTGLNPFIPYKCEFNLWK